MKSDILSLTISSLILGSSFSLFSQSGPPHPYRDYGGEDIEVLTLSNGKYNEFFDTDSIEIIGSAVLNTNTMKVVGFVEYDTVYSEATLEPEVVSRWLSRDPLAAKYPYASPYNFVLNSPIQAIDPDGKRVYFVAGAGNDGSGWKYPQRFKNIWERKGIKDFRLLNASRGKTSDILFTTNWRRDNVITVPRGPLIKSVDNEVIMNTVNQIQADLNANPLQEGEQLNLAGYSYGSVLQAQVALALTDKGIKVDNLVLIGSPISSDSPLYQKLLEAQEQGKIGNVSRQDIEGDKLSNPSSEYEYYEGAVQNRDGVTGPHFDLARPGVEADQKIEESAEQAKEDGVQ